MKAFDAQGFWWLPTAPSKQVTGTLRYTAEHGLRLSLTGTFHETSDSSTPDEYPMIHGIVAGSPFGKGFTLVDCFRTRLSRTMPGFSTAEICARRAYAGYCLLEEKDLRFDKLRIAFDQLGNWIRTTGIQPAAFSQGDDGYRVEIQYRQPKEISLALADKPLTIGFAFATSESVLRHVTLREDVQIALQDIDQLPFEEISERYVSPLNNFFTLATDTPNAVEEIVVYNNSLEVSDTGKPATIHVVYQPIHVTTEDPKVRLAHEMLFTYEDVKDSLSDILNGWIAFCREFDPFCTVFFGQQYGPSDSVDVRFLSLVHALTLLLGKARSDEEGVRRALNAAKEELRERLAREHEAWLTHMLPSEAEAELPWNLLAALEKHNDVMRPLVQDDPKTFVNTVLSARSYYTRFDSLLQPSVPSGEELHWLTEKLAILVKACILDSIGISRELAVKLIHRNRKYQHLRRIS